MISLSFGAEMLVSSFYNLMISFFWLSLPFERSLCLLHSNAVVKFSPLFKTHYQQQNRLGMMFWEDAWEDGGREKWQQHRHSQRNRFPIFKCLPPPSFSTPFLSLLPTHLHPQPWSFSNTPHLVRVSLHLVCSSWFSYSVCFGFSSPPLFRTTNQFNPASQREEL